MRLAPADWSTMRAPAVISLFVLLASACSNSGTEGSTSVAVTGTDSACEIAQDQLAAGKIDFNFTNNANDVSELYVLRDNDDIVSEVENVTTGTSRTLTADLVAGTYRVTCKPGQTGDGFSSDFQVTGEGGTAQADADTTINFDAHDFGYTGLEGLDDLEAGETVRFEMTNSGDQAHEFEVIKPDGEALGEVAAIDPGAQGGATMTFDDPGEYMFQCILIDEATGETHKKLGMVGSFTVS